MVPTLKRQSFATNSPCKVWPELNHSCLFEINKNNNEDQALEGFTDNFGNTKIKRKEDLDK